MNTTERALVLSEALPYIQAYNKKTVVIKYGGNAMQSEELKKAVISDVVLLSLVGIRVVVVHGGGPEINEQMDKIGKKPQFVNGLRYTDGEAIKVVQMVLSGKTNKDLVALLGQSGGKAIGICGLDGRMIKAQKLSGGTDLGFVGDITGIDAKPILDLLDMGYIPVVATVGYDDDGNVYNINADTAAARIASELKAENLILMTDTRGLLRNASDEETLIPSVNISDVPSLIRQEIISGGMIPKIESCVESIRRGVQKSIIIDGRIPHSILIEMLTNEGIGTLFHN